jgi:O-antigen ligase/polysaccharide polymerase Wzy-like membrane protein
MRRAVLLTAVAVLLAAPTALAFFSGGYFDEACLIATLGAWALVLVAAIVSPRPLPTSAPGRIAVGALALLAIWTGASIAWAPLSQQATASLVRTLLYLGALIAAAALLRSAGTRRAVEPALAAGALVVIGYGLSERLLPGVIELNRSLTADGRLEQPITYWNAEGALAAMGFVLCARLAGTPARSAPLRVAAAAAAVPLGVGVYLSFSRGAIAAAVVGLIVLLAAAPTWPQLRAIVATTTPAVVAAAVAAALPGVASLDGTLGDREGEGAIMLAVLVAAMLAAALAQARLARRDRPAAAAPATPTRSASAPAVRDPGDADRLPWAHRITLLAAAAVAAGLILLVVAGLSERGGDDGLSQRRGAARLASVESQRYEYWRVGLDAFAAHPLVGVGAAGFRVEWLRERSKPDTALEVHSLPLEMAVELGLVGLLCFGLFIGGVAVASARALRANEPPAAGAVGAVTVFALHAAIDWDWQLPAVTLPALVLAGALLAGSESAAIGSRADSRVEARRPPQPTAPDPSPS